MDPLPALRAGDDTRGLVWRAGGVGGGVKKRGTSVIGPGAGGGPGEGVEGWREEASGSISGV